MKPNANNLERLVRKAVKGQQFSESDLLFHWQALGRAGDRIVIDTLNQTNGWRSFLTWVTKHAGLRERLQTIVEAAGIPVEATPMLREAGIDLVESDSPRLRAQWIEQAIVNDVRGDWTRARTMLVADEEVFAGVLSLLRRHDSPNIVAFFSTLLEEPLTPEMDRQVRKLLYRLKQKGVGSAETTGVRIDELFAFAENRIPMWQPLFYFRSHSAYSELGDVFLIGIMEGQSFEIIDQKSDVRMTPSAWKQIVNGYSDRMRQDTGFEMPYHDVSPEHARFLLHRSRELLAGQPRGRGLDDFLKFLANKNPADAFASLTSQTIMSDVTPLDHPYFAAWTIDTATVKDFLQRKREAELGPIVLPEAQIRERTSELTRTAIHDYFSGSTRDLWAFAFEKAAFYLRHADHAASSAAWSVALRLRDKDAAAENIPQAVLMFERTVQFVEQQQKTEEEKEKRASLIMSPEEFQRMQQPRRR